MGVFTKDCGPNASPEHLASCPVCIEAQRFCDELLATIWRHAAEIIHSPTPPTAAEIIAEAARRRLDDA